MSTKLTDEQIAAVMLKAGWPRSSLATGVAVAKAESGGDYASAPRKGQAADDRGLFQINQTHWSDASNLRIDGQKVDPNRLTTDPVYNARVAKAVYDARGSWQPWTAYNNSAYRQYTSSTSSLPFTIPDGDDVIDAIIGSLPGGSGIITPAVAGAVGIDLPNVGNIIGGVDDFFSFVGSKEGITRIVKGAMGIVLIIGGIAFVARGQVTGIAKDIIS
jgi:hypothetical protein